MTNATAQATSIPAPVGGWNASDPIAQMPLLDAVQLDNFFPTRQGVMLRYGFTEFAELSDGTQAIKSLIRYSPPGGSEVFFAGTQGGIYDVTAGGTIGAVSSVATNGEWNYTNITTAGGSFVWLANGTDKSRVFNGTTWTVLDGASVPALTGITSENIANVSLFKTRLIFCVEGSLSFWYLPINSIAGAAVEFPLGAIFRRGGYLVATDSWTIDGGNGPDDYFVAVGSEGEVVVYSGTDPAAAATWAIVGVYQTGKPLGRQCFTRIKGDLALITEAGVISISSLMQSDTIRSTASLNEKIAPAFQSYVDRYRNEYGWNGLFFQLWNMLFINVPFGGSRSIQCVMNTQTGAWSRFVNWDNNAMEMFQDLPFFARGNKVYKGWFGQNDNNNAIIAAAKTSFTYFGSKAYRNRITLLRLLANANQSVPVQLGIASDFAAGALQGSLATYTATTAIWDVSLWDQALWPGAEGLTGNWRTVASYPGKAQALALRMSTKGVTFNWYATEYILQKGGML